MIIRVLYADENTKESNDASIVLKVTYNKVSFLLMEDADTAIEDYIRGKYDGDRSQKRPSWIKHKQFCGIYK